MNNRSLPQVNFMSVTLEVFFWYKKLHEQDKYHKQKNDLFFVNHLWLDHEAARVPVIVVFGLMSRHKQDPLKRTQRA